MLDARVLAIWIVALLGSGASFGNDSVYPPEERTRSVVMTSNGSGLRLEPTRPASGVSPEQLLWRNALVITGGADKVGHMYATYVGTRLGARLFE